MLTKRLENYTNLVATKVIERLIKENKEKDFSIENLTMLVMSEINTNEELKERIEVMSCHSCGN